MFTLVVLVLSFGNIGVQVAYAVNTEPKCYSRFDYDFRMLESIVDMKHSQKTLQDLVEKLEASVATQDTVIKLQDLVKMLEAKVAAHDTVNIQLQDLVEKLEAKLDAQEQLVEDQAVSVAKYHESLQDTESGSTYVRWGRTLCPNNGTTLIYKGFAGGSHYSQSGSGADYQCLPEDPTWGKYQDGTQGSKASMYGTEYEPSSLHFDSLADQEVPCAVCLTTRSTSIMIPARTSCYPGWTLEYGGNLASAHRGHKRAQYTCIDKEAEGAPGTDPSDNNGALFYAVEGRCGSLHCPPYVEGRELTCVVCSK